MNLGVNSGITILNAFGAKAAYGTRLNGWSSAPIKGPEAFADEAAAITENAARSRGLNPSLGIMNMAITRKQALKRIEGLIGEGSQAGIEAHIGKLTRPGSGPHIRAELTTRLAEI